eukprot:CAMPEP_0198655300 /NCGR_PEP_ID=MMETSP1467-20131203/8276_1 /TAXON_ID=1462469 /ORGANISM="unid. sp., Strain CCMP2135" /LENGTH=52 /DNA_ID=CAMNT_0044391305 /DNA_START=6 /DNA_END=161 /DNA_ORIENTATION=-
MAKNVDDGRAKANGYSETRRLLDMKPGVRSEEQQALVDAHLALPADEQDHVL